MSKTVSLPPVRVEPEMRDALQQIADRDGVSLYASTRLAVSEYIARHEPTTPTHEDADQRNQ